MLLIVFLLLLFIFLLLSVRLDAHERLVGRVQVESVEGDLLCGKLLAGPAFAAVEHLFRAFEEPVNAQALSIVEEVDAAIRRLGLHFRARAGGPSAPVHDVQIWGDGSLSLRLSNATPTNGVPGQALCAQPAEK